MIKFYSDMDYRAETYRLLTYL